MSSRALPAALVAIRLEPAEKSEAFADRTTHVIARAIVEKETTYPELIAAIPLSAVDQDLATPANTADRSDSMQHI